MLGSLLSAGASLIGGFFNRQSNENINSQNIAAQERANQANIEQAQRNNQVQIDIANQNIGLQKEFAQSGLQWKAEDAIRAGIHPLYAMGAPNVSFSPVSVGSSSADVRAPTLTSSDAMGDALAKSGQDIGRAIDANSDSDTRDQRFTLATRQLALTRAGLENELLASQIAKTRSQIGPGIPGTPNQLIDGQPATDLATPAGAAIKADDIKQQPDTASKYKRIRPLGIKLYTTPGTTDAEDLETRYGNVVEGIGGAGNLIADGAYTAYKYWPVAKDWLKSRQRRRGSVPGLE